MLFYTVDKPCSECHRHLAATAEFFYRHKMGKHGLSACCKTCDLARRQARKEDRKRWRREYYAKNPALFAEKRRRRWVEDGDKWREYYRTRAANRRADPQHRLSTSMSTAIRQSLFGGKRNRSWPTLVGYDTEALRQHPERQFLPGMTWENYGQWHIDHITPLSAFHYTSPEHMDFKRAWALSNLRPLWAWDNRSKGAKLERPLQSSLQTGAA